jgi:hypothetical protein
MVWLGIAATVGLALVAWAGVFHRTLRPENYPLVKPGMALKQVEALLGGPPGDYGWFFVGTSLMTQEGFKAPAGSTEGIWFNDDHRIEVYFDSRGRVVALHKRAKWERRPWPW